MHFVRMTAEHSLLKGKKRKWNYSIATNFTYKKFRGQRGNNCNEYIDRISWNDCICDSETPRKMRRKFGEMSEMMEEFCFVILQTFPGRQL